MDNKHQSSWDFFFTEINELPASIALDLALNKIAPVKDKPYSTSILISMNNPTELGLSTKEESEILFQIEDKLVEELSGKLGGIFAGRVTNDGIRSLHFFLKDKDKTKKTVKECMSNFPEYTSTLEINHDTEWKDYFDYLYPSPEEMQTILNRMVIHNLKEKGDNLSIPREVSHYVYFKKENDKESFLEEAKQEGYSVASENLKHDSKEYPFGARITRNDSVELQNVDEYTSFLFELAEDHNGVYDGWETKLIK